MQNCNEAQWMIKKVYIYCVQVKGENIFFKFFAVIKLKI